MSSFSWKIFFLNAKIEEEAAQRYATAFEKEKITEDLVSELDQDLMEMAGITSVGDKMRIAKYVKSGYSRSACLDNQSSAEESESEEKSGGTTKKSSKTKSSKSKSDKSSSKKKMSRSTSQKKLGKVEVPKSTETETRRSEPQPVQEEEVITIPPPSIPSMPARPIEIAAGFQLKAECSFRNRVTQIRVASSLSKSVSVK